MTKLTDRIAQKTKEYNALYERFAPQFEREHLGEFVALSHGKEPLFGPDEETVLEQAIARFGRGNFGFWQVGK